MPQSVKALLQEAHAQVPRIAAEDAKAMLDRGEAVALDVREPVEVTQSGKVPGAVAVPRGLLEFRADPDMPSHEPRLDRSKAVITYCASGTRSALAGKTLKELGYERVFNLGGFKDWTDAGFPIEH